MPPAAARVSRAAKVVEFMVKNCSIVSGLVDVCKELIFYQVEPLVAVKPESGVA